MNTNICFVLFSPGLGIYNNHKATIVIYQSKHLKLCPTPRVENVYNKLGEGYNLDTLDLSNAYQQNVTG